MPAEIDTGGPRVLHCDYRADCPIPIVVSASIAESSPQREDRHRVNPHRRSPTGRRTRHGLREYRRTASIEATNARNVPNDGGNDDYVCQRFQDSDIPTCQEERLASRLRPIDDAPRYRRHHDDFTRESTRTCTSTRRREGRSWSAKREFPVRDWRTVLGVGETTRVCIGRRLFSSHRPRRSSTYEDRTYEKIVEHPHGESSEETVASDSWRLLPTRVREEIDAADGPSEFPHYDETTGRSGGRRAWTKTRSYFQLALLLFLVAFGHSGLLKSGVVNFSAKASTTGLSVLAIGTVISAVSAAPVDLMGDAGVRAERSANLSHITGASRKIQMYIKNRHLQILPDGTVNGSNDDTSDYTIFQRTSVSRGQLRIQGVATCLYLCMDSCGLLYGSREYTEDCVFNETLEQHNYNTYSSVRWSTAKKTLYLGLNRRGQPRRVQAKGHNLGRLSAYARVLTQVAPADRVEALQRRMLGAHHNVRHRHNSHVQHHHRPDVIQQSLCPTLPAQEQDGRDRFRCRKRKKRKKRKRRCRPGEKPGPQCQITEEADGVVVAVVNTSTGKTVETTTTTRTRTMTTTTAMTATRGTTPESKRSCEGAASEEACRREALSVPSKKRKLRVEEPATVGATSGASRNATSKGKNKPPASNAKKVSVAGSMSQSKKPNLTDGKKRKRKGSPVRRNPLLLPGRKRFVPGKADNTSAVLTATLAPGYTTSFSSWWSPGASTVPSAGRGLSPRRRTKTPASSRNEFGSANGSSVGTVSPRRLGKAVARPFARTKSVARVTTTTTTTKTTTTSAYETTTVLDRYPPVAYTEEVPEASAHEGSRSTGISSSLETSGEMTEDTSRTTSLDALSLDEDQSSTVSNEHGTSTLDTTTSTGIIETTTIHRPIEDETKSIEDTSNDDDDDDNEDGDDVRSTTPRFPLERLAM